MSTANFEDIYGDNERREGHASTNPDGTCSDLTCPCQQWSKQESALSDAAYQSLRDSVLERVHAAMAEDCNCPLHQTADGNEFDPVVLRRISTAIRQDQTFASLTTIRSAIFDVIDKGGPAGWWELYDLDDDPEVTEEMLTQERCDFVDAVERRILQLQQPPHEMDAGLRVVREDVAEMGRLVQEREGR